MNERKLWAEVLTVLIRDAVGPISTDNTPLEKRRSQAIIKSGGAWFQWVCMAAGFDPDAVREKYLAGKIDPAEFTELHKGRIVGAAAKHAESAHAAISIGPMTVRDVAARMGVSQTLARETLHLLRVEGRAKYNVTKDRTRVWRAVEVSK